MEAEYAQVKERMQRRLDHMRREIPIYEAQIERAVAEGKDGFDSERFGKTKK